MMADSQHTLDTLRQRIAALPPEKRALFTQQLRQQGWSVPEAPLRLQTRPAQVPLSAAQAHVWVLHQLDPQSAAYNIPMAWRLAGDLDINCLARSFQAIGQRHESLRTVFVRHPESAQPYQHIQSQGTLPLALSDLRYDPLAAAEAETQRLAQQMARQPFDLSQGPLWRCHLIRLQDRLAVLVLVLHHMAADGWSRGVLMQEFAALYRAACRGQTAELPPLPVQYADYALWQQQWLQGQACRSHLDYWRQQLADLPTLALPLDRARRAVPDLASRTCTHTVPAACTAALKTLSRQEGVTLFMTLLAAFSVLLQRYSGQDDLAIGVPVANRHQAEVEPLIGFFVNTLVVRTRLSGNPTLRQLLRRVKDEVTQAFQHQDIPFTKIVEALQPERDVSRTPLFQVMFQLQNDTYALQNAATPALDLPGLTLTQVWVDPGQTKFDLTWHVIDRADTLLVAVEYRTALFDAARMARMLAHFQTLLAELVAAPERRLSDLTILSPQERQQLLVTWNRTDTPLPPVCFHDLFAQQAQQTPTAIAVQDGQRQLTYSALDDQANQLADRLRHQGIGPEQLVGICLPRSVNLMVALLGVLKAGGAYVPLDPGLPPERLRFILGDANVAAVIVSEATLPLVAAWAPAVLLNLDRDWQHDAPAPFDPGTVPVTLDNLAYVMYTSGSTGKPKGTLVTHRGMVNYVRWGVQAYAVAAGGAPVQSSIGFDATMTSLYTPLLAGQPVVLLPEGHEVERLSAVLQDAAAFSLIKLTPAHLQALQPVITPAARPPKTFVIGGEALLARDVAFWQAHFPDLRLVNEYGPTETVVGCCVYTVAPGEDAAEALPIGRPIANVQLYILDPYLQPVPVGVPGELYIGGAGVARGYLQRPDLTAAQFIPNPFVKVTPAASTVLYKTGDRVQYRADGTIDYLGRCDNQVKLRGFRIELGEIEAALHQQEQIAQAVVVLHATPGGAAQLVAYVVLTVNARPAASAGSALPAALHQQIRQQLHQHLPAYMIPSRFMVLAALPLTPNGKIDRQALPAPEAEPLSPAGDRVAPQDARQRQLVAIWQRVLGREGIGIHDNFFARGGDSILGMQIIAQAHAAGLRLTPRQLFQYQTIAELAAVATLETDSGPEQQLVTGPVPLTPIQRDFFAQCLPAPHHFNQAMLLTVDPGIKPEIVARALQHLALHHDSLRLRFYQDENGWQQVHAEAQANLVSWCEIDLSQVADAQRQAALDQVLHDLHTSLHLSQGPLLQGAVLRLGAAAGTRLLLLAHHLIVDGVSWRMLLEDLATAYGQLAAGAALHLPPTTTSFQTWANHVLAASQRAALASERPYWTQACAVPPPLPVDNPGDRATNTVAAQRQVSVTLSPEHTRALLEDIPAAYHTQITDVLLTALAQTLRQWSQATTVVIDLEHHGRQALLDTPTLDLSRTVGWFTAVFPMRLVLPPGSVIEQLKAVQDQRRGVPNQGVGYGLLRHLTYPDDLALRSPAEISLNYLGHIEVNGCGAFISGLAPEPVGARRSAAGQRRYLLDVVAMVAAGALHIIWRYSSHFHRPGTIEQLAQRYLTALRSILAYSQSPQADRYTPADFAAARLNQGQLDRFLSKIQPREP